MAPTIFLHNNHYLSFHFINRFSPCFIIYLDFPCASVIKNPPANTETQETQIWSLGQKDPLDGEMATHSSILAWKILWTEEPDKLWSRGCNELTWLSNSACVCVCACTRTHTHTHLSTYIWAYQEYCKHQGNGNNIFEVILYLFFS